MKILKFLVGWPPNFGEIGLVFLRLVVGGIYIGAMFLVFEAGYLIVFDVMFVILIVGIVVSAVFQYSLKSSKHSKRSDK